MAIGLSVSRFHAWMHSSARCQLPDHTSCPRVQPQRLTPGELSVIHGMVTAVEFAHVSIGSLALHAQRLGRVFVSPTTWWRLVKKHGWRRPGRRIHPGKRRVGVRAQLPNELWHCSAYRITSRERLRAMWRAVVPDETRGN